MVLPTPILPLIIVVPLTCNIADCAVVPIPRYPLLLRFILLLPPTKNDIEVEAVYILRLLPKKEEIVFVFICPSTFSDEFAVTSLLTNKVELQVLAPFIYRVELKVLAPFIYRVEPNVLAPFIVLLPLTLKLDKAVTILLNVLVPATFKSELAIIGPFLILLNDIIIYKYFKIFIYFFSNTEFVIQLTTVICY